MKNVFPGSLKPSRQCSCCPTNTEIYIVCQVHAPDLDDRTSTQLLLHSKFLVLIVSSALERQVRVYFWDWPTTNLQVKVP